MQKLKRYKNEVMICCENEKIDFQLQNSFSPVFKISATIKFLGGVTSLQPFLPSHGLSRKIFGPEQHLPHWTPKFFVQFAPNFANYSKLQDLHAKIPRSEEPTFFFLHGLVWLLFEEFYLLNISN